MTKDQFLNGFTTKTYGTGPFYVSAGRNADGCLAWVEIVTGDEALFRADKPARETDLLIARQMVRAFNSRYADVSALAEVAA